VLAAVTMCWLFSQGKIHTTNRSTLWSVHCNVLNMIILSGVDDRCCFEILRALETVNSAIHGGTRPHFSCLGDTNFCTTVSCPLLHNEWYPWAKPNSSVLILSWTYADWASRFQESRERREILHLRDNSEALAKVKLILPHYNFDNFAAPTSVCSSCLSRLLNRYPFNSARISKTVELISGGSQSRAGICSAKCKICHGIRKDKRKSPVKPPPRTEISPKNHRANRPG